MPVESLSTPAPPRVVLRDIRWETFEALLEFLGERRARIAYDGGTLELMSPSQKHEWLKRLIGRLIEAFTEELGIDILSCGSTTLKSALKECGVEPDECYYVEHEPAVRGREDIDLRKDPPPDLAIEISITRGIVNRKVIFAALGVPELWVHDGKGLKVLRLQGGEYRASATSGVFPSLPIAEVSRFLEKRKSTSETSLVRTFRSWVRERFGTGGEGPPRPLASPSRRRSRS
jgi:Uma2 family endonuclease